MKKRRIRVFTEEERKRKNECCKLWRLRKLKEDPDYFKRKQQEYYSKGNRSRAEDHKRWFKKKIAEDPDYLMKKILKERIRSALKKHGTLTIDQIAKLTENLVIEEK